MKRRALLVVLASIALNAALGIYALLAGEFGELEAKILFSSLSVSGAGILSLACMLAWEQRKLGVVPRLGVATALVGFGLLIVGVWDEFDHEAVAQAAQTLIALAAASALTCLLSLAQLAPRFRFAFPAAAVLSFVLAGLIASAIWGDWSSGAFARSVGVVAVLLAALTVAIPILHRVSRQELAAAQATPGRVAHCPVCGYGVSAAPDEETSCAACGTRFAVRLVSP